MSTSRLEKFIYAICSMEVSDLPAPLSRIEILWNCLITGETPDFEPQSRNEQYLMAMLGLYELENLPTPISRGEKLLYKIAMGETDLSDVPGYLSRYEELLKYLIENGGVGDFEYILQTLNQRLNTLYSTKERPVKSAILSGQTLVNLCKDSWWNGSLTNGYDITQSLKPNNKYIIFVNSINNIAEINLAKSDFIPIVYSTNNNDNYFIFTTPDSTSELTKVRIVFSEVPSSEPHYEAILLEYQEGIENWDIPYFEGMKSVKMPVLTTTGKNLFDVKKFNFNDNSDFTLNGNTITCKYTKENSLLYLRLSDLNLKPNTAYRLSTNCSANVWIGGMINRGSWIWADNTKPSITFTTPNNLDNVLLVIKNISDLTSATISNIQLEEGSTATAYEPYKSNILSTPEDLELCGIGDVKDTLDISTGEKVECIGEIVLDGSEDENWIYDGQYDVFVFEGLIYANNYLSTHILDKITWNGADRFALTPSNYGITSNSEGIEYLSNHPITLQYELATPIVKTVDLITVDQDGQPTRLKTFNDITYVKLSSEGLIPEVELEVATKISETLSTMGPQQLNISETQNKLGQTIDEQTENTDAAMLATTEIYEQTL